MHLKPGFSNKLPPESAQVLFAEDPLDRDPVDPGIDLQNGDTRSEFLQFNGIHPYTYEWHIFIALDSLFNLSAQLANAPNDSAALTFVPLGSILFSG